MRVDTRVERPLLAEAEAIESQAGADRQLVTVPVAARLDERGSVAPQYGVAWQRQVVADILVAVLRDAAEVAAADVNAGAHEAMRIVAQPFAATAEQIPAPAHIEDVGLRRALHIVLRVHRED